MNQKDFQKIVYDCQCRIDSGEYCCEDEALVFADKLITDMLEALKWACARYECYHNPDVRGNCSTCAIGKAIAKAEGSEL